MKVGILVHGRHLQARQWERIVWGEPPHLLGQVPKALLVFLEESAENQVAKMVFGTGASEKEGLKEAEYTLRFMFANLPNLSEFAALSECPFWNGDTEELADRLRGVSCPEITSRNTAEEVRAASRIFQANGVRKVIQVTCSTHLPRCALQGFLALHKGFHNWRPSLYITASDVGYADSKPEEVVIFEPPHRGDLPTLPLHKVVRRIFNIPWEEMPEFLSDLERLLAQYET